MTQDGKLLVQVLARINSERGWVNDDGVMMSQFDLRSLDKTVRVKPLTMPALEATEAGLSIGSTLVFTVVAATPEEIKAFYER